MFSSHRHTIVFVTCDLVARVDLHADACNAAVSSSTADRSSGLDLMESIQQAITLESSKPGQLWILSDAFWSGNVELAEDIASQITTKQVEQAIALEAEFDSGISAFESQVGYVPALNSGPGQSSWWTVQIESSLIKSIESSVKNSAARVLGMASTEPFRAEDVERHARQWLDNCLAASPRVPVVRFSTPSFSANHPRLFGMIATCAVVLACGTIHIDGKHKFQQATVTASELKNQKVVTLRRISERQVQARQLRDSRKQQEANAAQKMKQLQQVRQAQHQYESRRKRPAELFNALSATANQEHWIQSFRLEKERVIVTGLALNHAAITRLAGQLEQELSSDRWSVQPTTMQVDPDIELVRFEITLVTKKTMPKVADRLASHGGTKNVR